jgi:hypothetical protein
MVKPIPLLLAALTGTLMQCAPGPQKIPPSGNPVRLEVSSASLNTASGKAVRIRVSLPPGSQARADMVDAHGWPVRRLFEGKVPADGRLQWEWDGRDDSGETVPNEAYTPKLSAILGVDTLIYDPPRFSGGETFTISKATVDLSAGTVTYALEKNSRVMVRAGRKKGMLLKSVAHLAPRLKGTVTEFWNGSDGDNLLSAKDLEDWNLVISGFALPENAIVTYGNQRTSYREYLWRRFSREIEAGDFPNASPGFVAVAGKRKEINMHFFQPLLRDFPPTLEMDFPNSSGKTPEGIPILEGSQRVMVDIALSEKSFNRDQQFEVGLFLDGKFIAEDEMGYAPYNWIWNVSDVPAGEHILSVNLSSFRDQIGTKSVKVRIGH